MVAGSIAGRTQTLSIDNVGNGKTVVAGEVFTIADVYAINPLTGAQIPVWIADYVLMGYGTGAIMAVPCGDQRDFEFARKYALPIRTVAYTSDPVILAQRAAGSMESEGDFYRRNIINLSRTATGIGDLYLSARYRLALRPFAFAIGLVVVD